MMNTEEIVQVLKNRSDLSDYEYTKVTKHASELFFVKKKMELNRVVNTDTISIQVYKDVEDKRGSSMIAVTSADDASSLDAKITAAVKKAETALNPYYPLASNQASLINASKQNESLNDIALKVAEAIDEANQSSESWLNATEIFVYVTRIEFMNSNDVHHVDTKLSVEFETIPTSSHENEEFESYKYYRNNTFDKASIENDIRDILHLVKQRSIAKHIDTVNITKDTPVYMYGEMANLIAGNIMENTSYASHVTQSNHYDIDKPVSNTKFDMILKGQIEGAANARAFDNHGVVLKETEIIHDGINTNLFGDIQYGHYLNAKEITGSYPVAEIKAKNTVDALQPHLIIDHFSAPQLESASGYFGGEVRLARYFDGEKYIPLTGFSITGNIYEALQDVEFSSENTTTQKYQGPKYFIFKNLNIA